MRRIAFHVNHEKPGADAVRARLTALAASVGLEVVTESPDAVVVLGGDGTMLSAVHEFRGVPLLGLNLGSLGYLAGVEEPHFADAIRALVAGEFSISWRTALDVCGNVALNDVVISKGASGHAAEIELSVDSRPATRFFADGLVIATPTGSTAYSLAAGGPILLPSSDAFVVTPVCPHALASRPLVVRDGSRFTVRQGMRQGAEALEVFADGRAVARLGAGDSVDVAKASEKVPLVELEGYDPFEVLGRKLGWNGVGLRREAR